MKYLSPLNNIRYQILFIFHISFVAFNSFLLHYYVDFLKIWQIKLDFLDHLISTFNFVRLVLCPSFFLNAQFLKCMCFELKFSSSLNLTYCISIWYFQLFTMYFEFSAFLIQTNYLYKKLETMKCHTLRKLLIKGSSKIKQVNAEDGGVIFKNRGVYYNSFKIFLF